MHYFPLRKVKIQGLCVCVCMCVHVCVYVCVCVRARVFVSGLVNKCVVNVKDRCISGSTSWLALCLLLLSH